MVLMWITFFEPKNSSHDTCDKSENMRCSALTAIFWGNNDNKKSSCEPEKRIATRFFFAISSSSVNWDFTEKVFFETSALDTSRLNKISFSFSIPFCSSILGCVFVKFGLGSMSIGFCPAVSFSAAELVMFFFEISTGKLFNAARMSVEPEKISRK